MISTCGDAAAVVTAEVNVSDWSDCESDVSGTPSLATVLAFESIESERRLRHCIRFTQREREIPRKYDHQ